MGLARTLIENSPDFIIFRDLQGRILHTSRSLDEFLGLPHRGFVDDLGLRDILAPATAEQFLQFDEEVVRTGQRVRHSILRFETLDGRSRLVRVAHERVKGGAGLPAGLLTFAANITESVDEHNRLRVALEKAEEVAAAKWQFMANVTHEIRNPINAIQGLCETALEGPGTDPAEVLAKIQRCATELEDMVRDVLDFSRLDRGNITVEHIPFNPVRALEEVVAQFQHQASRKGVELAALARADCPHSVLGDPVKFRRVLANLIGNAVKFTAQGHVHAELHFERRQERLLAHCAVQDSGIGIPADRLESIFEPFTQADASTTRRFGGTGLGLNIVRSLVLAMDGFIKVKSEPGKGSCFTAAMMVDHNPAHEAPTPPDLRDERILLVGGDAAIRHWLKRSLQAWGATCAEAETGEEAEAAWLEAEETDRPFARAVIDLPEDINPRLPAIPTERTLLLTAPELELSRQTQLLKPVTLTGLWARFAGEPPRAPEAADADAPPRPPRRPLRILLAEDNEVNREVAVARLRRAGHHVSATVDGAAALELWRTKDFDAVLLDIQMPVMDGIATATAIRAEERALGRRPTRLLALTAMTLETDRARCEAAGFDAYLAKPVRGAELLEKLEVCVAQEAPPPILGNEFLSALEVSEADEAEDLRCAARSYLRHAEGMIAQLGTALARRDAVALERHAHGTKGMLALMGCVALAKLAGTIERQPDGPEIGPQVNELIDGLRKLRESLVSRADLTPHGQAEDQA
jgi:PAS domain S-box-containing protein